PMRVLSSDRVATAAICGEVWDASNEVTDIMEQRGNYRTVMVKDIAKLKRDFKGKESELETDCKQLAQ
ncbi:unnamed protein product, partial [Prorocentrum cordatum]